MPGAVPRAQDRQSRPAGGAGDEDATGSGPFTVGQDVEVTIEDVAQGGWCIARPEGLPVMFVRHTLPGERVVARVTEVTSKFARADAVDILVTSADRVDAPCPHARPGGCGGCDWQHASLVAQRALKGSVITQQLRRLAGIERQVTVEALADKAQPEEAQSAEAQSAEAQSAEAQSEAASGLGWRTRVQFAVDRDGVAGLRGHRSHRVIDIGDCLIAHQTIRDLDIPGDEWTGATTVEVAVGGAETPENFAVTVVEESGHGQRGRGERNRNRQQARRRSRPKRTLVEGRPYLAERAAGRIWQVGADGFWQVHPAAADTFSAAVTAALEPKPGDTVLDLYSGAGLFAGVVAPLVGRDGAVIAVESDQAAVRNARQNLADYPWVTVKQADVAAAAAGDGLPPARLVIADPPRAGLAREVIDHLTGSGTGGGAAERFAYVSCDPATLARDLALLIAGGWRLDDLRAFDAFPMTHHVECVATLVR